MKSITRQSNSEGGFAHKLITRSSQKDVNHTGRQTWWQVAVNSSYISVEGLRLSNWTKGIYDAVMATGLPGCIVVNASA